MTENITYLHTQVVTRVHSSKMRIRRLQSRGSLYSEVQVDKVWNVLGSLYGEVQCITGNGHMEPPPSPWTEWQTWLITLPSRNFVGRRLWWCYATVHRGPSVAKYDHLISGRSRISQMGEANPRRGACTCWATVHSDHNITGTVLGAGIGWCCV